ncbi:MAG: aldo/keto reductase [Lentisphaeria bacterium]|nr:aldo/keto reductase [Lentisphaeria bacterium]
MQYRSFGSFDFEASALGFGCMRLPTIGDDPAKIDEPAATAMLRHAIDQGVNYIDTAYPYHGGMSEVVVGRALKDGYRERVKLVTKLPLWMVENVEDVDRLLNEQLERLDDGFIDIYLVHNICRSLWPIVEKCRVLERLEAAKAAGKIGQIGFSFHDCYDLFAEVVDSYDGWALAQIQYNYANETMQAGTKGLEYAASKGLATVIMEPLLGGCLVTPPPSVAEALLDAPVKKRAPVEWALQWLWNKPEVGVVLSGMGEMCQVEENLSYADASGVGMLTEAELAVVARAAEAHAGVNAIPCTSCRYCMPCPHGVDIPHNFNLFNGVTTFGGNQVVLNPIIYSLLPEESRASGCVGCKVCEERCPQGIEISAWMPKVHEELGAS